MQFLMEHAGRRMPVLAGMVRENMRRLDVYSEPVFRSYFRHVASHFAAALHAFRTAPSTSQQSASEEFLNLAAERIELDDSVQNLAAVAARGAGVILIGPHLADFMFSLARLNQVAPLTIYMRYSKDPHRRAAKRLWCRAAGMSYLYDSPQQAKARGRLARLSAAIREGRTIYLTPDLPRKREQGTAVRFFDREVYLPAGAAVLAARTGAAVLMLTAQAHAGRIRLRVSKPLEVERGRSARETVQAYLDQFAQRFERFVVEQPGLWYFWADKRWTRILSGDQRYVRALDDASAQSCRAPLAKAT